MVPRGRPWRAGCAEESNGRGEGLKGGEDGGGRMGDEGVVGEGERLVRAQEKGGSNRCEDSKAGRKSFGGFFCFEGGGEGRRRGRQS